MRIAIACLLGVTTLLSSAVGASAYYDITMATRPGTPNADLMAVFHSDTITVDIFFSTDQPGIQALAIGVVTPLRPGITLSTSAQAIEKAFTMRGADAVAIQINSPGGSPVQSALLQRHGDEVALAEGALDRRRRDRQQASLVGEADHEQIGRDRIAQQRARQPRGQVAQ